MTDPDLSPDDRLARFLAEYDDRLAAGQPVPAGPGDAPGGTRLALDVACLHLLDQLRRPDGGVPADAPPAPPDGPRYELGRLHAAGGIGRVWVARDTELGREVALKELRPERASDPGLVARFVREARITSRLQHPGIVPVYEMAPAEDGGPPFYTMRLIRGRTLTEAARDYHARHAGREAGAVELIRLLNAFVSVCNTVAYAHTQGVIHRDLKGQNVVLGDFGEVIVLDWGLASEPAGPAPEADAPDAAAPDAPPAGLGPLRTRWGVLLGTPAYMAPEQAEGRVDRIDARTDVFGLGAMLFEVLTGRPPFTGQDTAEVVARARAALAPRPRDVCRGVPRPLAAVCEKAMALDPERRYASAADVAREVQHWMADEPVAAYREPLPARWQRWARRHRPLLAAAAALLLTGGAAVGLLADARSREARIEADTRARADAAAQRRLELQLYFQRLALAERELTAQNLGRVSELLAACPARLRGWEWRYLYRHSRTDPLVLRGHKAAASAVAFSPDGRVIASAGHDRTARLWDAATGREEATLEGHADAVYDLAFSPGGETLATASWDGTVKLWDVAGRRERLTFRGHRAPVQRLVFHPAGRLVASIGSDGVLLWDPVNGSLVGRLGQPGQLYYRPAFSPDGSRLALTNFNQLEVWDVETLRLAWRRDTADEYVKCVAFSPDSATLATGEGDLARGEPGRVRLWSAADGTSLGSLDGHSEPVFGLAFSPDGARLYSASQDQTVKVWDLATRQEALTLRGHADTVRGLAVSGDGHRLVTAGADGTVRVWDATPGEPARSPWELHRLTGRHSGPVFALAFRPGGRELTTVDLFGGVRTWGVRTGAPLHEFAAPVGGTCFCVAYSPDGRRVAVAVSDGKVHLLDPATGAVERTAALHEPGPIKGLAFSPDGRRLASASWDRTVRVLPLDGGAPLVLAGHTQAVLGVAFSPDGNRLASAAYDNTVRVWDAATGEQVTVLRGHTSRVLGVAFSPSGRLLASAGNDHAVRVWDTTGWEPAGELRGHGGAVTALAFGQSDRYLATASQDRTVRVWDLLTRSEVATLRGHVDRVDAVAIHPDGTRLASAGHDTTVLLWQFPLPD